MIFPIGFSDALLATRVIAMYKLRSHLVCCAVLFLYAATYAIELALAGIILKGAITTRALGPASWQCSAGYYLAVIFMEDFQGEWTLLPLVLFNAILFILTLVQLGPLLKNSTEPRAGPLISRLMEGGTWYFGVNGVLWVADLIVMRVMRYNPALMMVLTPLLVVIPTLVSNRLFLGLRDLFHPRVLPTSVITPVLNTVDIG